MTEEKFCEVCGTQLTGKKKKYCSTKCRKKSQKIKKAEQQPVSLPVGQVNPVPPTPVSEFDKEQAEALKQLQNENAVKRAEKVSRQLDKETAGEDPLDRLIRIRQFNSMNEGSGGKTDVVALMMNQMTSERQINRQMFDMQVKSQEQAHQLALANQKQQHDFMIKQLEKNKDEGSIANKIKEAEESGKLLGMEKKDGDTFGKISELVGTNMKHIPEIVSSFKGNATIDALRAAGVLPPEQTPEQAPEQAPTTPTSPQPQTPFSTGEINPIPGGEEFHSKRLNIPPPPQDELPSTIAPKQLSDEEVEKYAQTHHIEGASDSDPNKILDQALGMGDYARARKEYKK